MPGPKRAAGPGGGDKIDSFGGPAHPRNFIGARRIDEARKRLARLLVLLISPPRDRVLGLAWIGIVALIEIAQRIDDGGRPLGGCGAVEGHTPIPRHGMSQCREGLAPTFSIMRSNAYPLLGDHFADPPSSTPA